MARDAKPATDDEGSQKASNDRGDTEGQISIHLPHNSLLIMHAEMQEVRDSSPQEPSVR